MRLNALDIDELERFNLPTHKIQTSVNGWKNGTDVEISGTKVLKQLINIVILLDYFSNLKIFLVYFKSPRFFQTLKLYEMLNVISS